MTIGERIKQRRIELEMSQDELAKKMGYKTRNAIYQFEQKANMKLSIVEKFASALDTTPAYLMGWEDESGNILVETATVPKSNLSFDQISQAEYLYKLYEKATPEIQSAVDLLLQSAQNQQNKEIPHLVAEKPRTEIPYLKRDNK